MTAPAWLRLPLLVGSGLLTIGCGTVVLAHPAHRYTITTGLLSLKGGPVMACHLIMLSLPPAGCSGVVVKGVDIRGLPGAHAFSNGTVETLTMRLVGRWDGQALTLTEPPVPAKPTPVAPTPVQASPAPITPELVEAQRRLNDDGVNLRSRGIHVREDGFDATGLYVRLAVADRAAVDYLRTRYTAAMRVEGWLQPL